MEETNDLRLRLIGGRGGESRTVERIPNTANISRKRGRDFAIGSVTPKGRQRSVYNNGHSSYSSRNSSQAHNVTSLIALAFEALHRGGPSGHSCVGRSVSPPHTWSELSMIIRQYQAGDEAAQRVRLQ